MRNGHFKRCARRLLPLVLTFVLMCGAGCAPSPQGGSADTRPELTEQKIRDTIAWNMVEQVPEESNQAKPINWTFLPDEPKEFSVLEKKMEGDKATVVVDMKTGSAERAEHKRELWGKLRLHYELQTDFVLRKWRIVHIENIDMKYRDEPKKPGALPTPEEQDEG